MNRKRIILVALVLIVFGFAYYCYGAARRLKDSRLWCVLLPAT